MVFELKILYKSLETTITEGLIQTAAYADQCGADEAYLLIFDRREGIPWEEKIWQRSESGLDQRTVSVWGM